jgi:hypothetical protein
MEKMEIEKEAQHLKAAKAISTCEDLSAHRDEDARDASGTTCRAPDGQQGRISETTPRSQDGEGYSNSFGRP